MANNDDVIVDIPESAGEEKKIGKNAARNKRKRDKLKASVKGSVPDTDSSGDRSTIGKAITPDVHYSVDMDRQFVDPDTGRSCLPLVAQILSIHPMGVSNSEFNNSSRRLTDDLSKIPVYSGFSVDNSGKIPLEVLELYFNSVGTLVAFCSILLSLISLQSDTLEDGFFKHRLLESIFQDYFFDMNFKKARFKTALAAFIKVLNKFFLPPGMLEAITTKFTPVSVETDGHEIIVMNCINLPLPDSYLLNPKRKIKSDFITFPFSEELVGKVGYVEIIQIIEGYTDDLEDACDINGEFNIMHKIFKMAQETWAIDMPETNPSTRSATSAEKTMRLNRWAVVPEMPVKTTLSYTHMVPGKTIIKKSILSVVNYGISVNDSPKFIVTNNTVRINDRKVRKGDYNLIDRDYNNVPGIFVDSNDNGLSSRDILEMEIPFVKEDNGETNTICEAGIFMHTNGKYGFSPFLAANPNLSDSLSNCINLLDKNKSNVISVVNNFLAINELTIVGYTDEENALELEESDDEDDITSELTSTDGEIDDLEDEGGYPLDEDMDLSNEDKSNITPAKFRPKEEEIPTYPSRNRNTLLGKWLPYTVYLSSHNINRKLFSYTLMRPHILAEAEKIWNTDSSTAYLEAKMATQIDSQYKTIPVNIVTVV